MTNQPFKSEILVPGHAQAEPSRTRAKGVNVPFDQSVRVLAAQYRAMKQSCPDYHVKFPDPKNPLLWHVSFPGVDDSPFAHGIYHIVLDFQHYPEQPPLVRCPHPTGTFYINVSLCIQGATLEGEVTGNYYTPGTTVDSIIRSVQMYMNSPDRGGVGFMKTLDQKDIIQKAIESRNYVCPECKMDHSQLKK